MQSATMAHVHLNPDILETFRNSISGFNPDSCRRGLTPLSRTVLQTAVWVSGFNGMTRLKTSVIEN